MHNAVAQLLTSSEAAEACGVQRATFTRWVQRGLVRPAYAGPGRTGARLFAPEEVARVAAEQAADTEETTDRTSSPKIPAGAPVADGAGEVVGTSPEAPTSPKSRLSEGASS